MRLMNGLTVRGKLPFAFGCVLMTMLGAFSVLQLSRVYGETDSILVYRLPGVRESMRMVEAANRFRTRESARKDYADFMASDEGRELYEAAIVDWKGYVSATSQTLALMRAGKAAEAREVIAGA